MDKAGTEKSIPRDYKQGGSQGEVNLSTWQSLEGSGRHTRAQ